MVAVAAAATAGSADEYEISFTKTGATKYVANESNDVINATMAMK